MFTTKQSESVDRDVHRVAGLLQISDERSELVTAAGRMPSSSLAKTRCDLYQSVETLARLFATISCLRSQNRRAAQRCPFR